MMLPPLEVRRARELLSRVAGVRVLVVGDIMLDRFIAGRVSRISPEAPVPVVQFQSGASAAGRPTSHNLAHSARLRHLSGSWRVHVKEHLRTCRRRVAADGLVGVEPSDCRKVRIVTVGQQVRGRLQRDSD